MIAATTEKPALITDVSVNAIQAQDIAELRLYFDRLSVQSRQKRLHATAAAVPDSVLNLYHNSIAGEHFRYAAVARLETIVGEVMLASVAEKDSVEVALSSEDQYRGRGIGKALLQHAITTGTKHHFKHMYADAYRSNKPFIGLAKSFGFTVKPHPDERALVRMVLELH